MGCSFPWLLTSIDHYSFILKETNFTRLFHKANAELLTVNEQFPGSTIHVRKGDTAFVNVHNDGQYGVTIHWHRVKQPQMDILLTKDQSPSYYYIAASSFFDSGAPFDNTTTTAILRYTNATTVPSSIPFPSLPSTTDN